MQSPGKIEKRIAGLDGLRALSIALVCLSHVQITPGFPLHLGFIRGLLGVQIFFVISGFLITELLLREEQESGRFSLGGFYYRRAFRILPAAFAYIAVVSIVSAFGRTIVHVRDVLAASLFVANLVEDVAPALAHYWSLSVEEQFYLLWPAVLCWTPRRWRLPCATLVMLLIPFWHQLNMKLFTAAQVNVARLDLNADAMLSGALVALGARTARGQRIIGRVAEHANVLLFLSLSFLFVFVAYAGGLPGIVGRPLTWGRQAACAILIVTAINARAFAAAALNARWVRYVGRLSYSLYLWQQPLLWTRTWGQKIPWFACWPQNIVFGCAAALVSYHCIERPILSWRDKHPYQAAPEA